MKNSMVEALRLILEPGQVTEVRVLDAVTPGDRRPHVESGYFDDMKKMAKAVEGITTAKGIYFVPNPVNPVLLARAANRIRLAGREPLTCDSDVTARRWLLIDCDPVRPAGISATDEEHDAAHQRARQLGADLQASGWPKPILADSGNGAHLLYRIDLPSEDGGLVQRCLEALAAAYDDEAVTIDRTVFNPARIWKLYGTWARKGDSTPERPHRLSGIVSTPQSLQVVQRELLEALAAKSKVTANAPGRSTTRRGRINESPEALKDYLEAHGVKVKAVGARNGGGHVLVLDACPMNPDHGHGTDTAVILTPNGVIGFECKHNGCSSYTWSNLRAKIDPKRRQSVTKPAGGSKPAPPIPSYGPFPVACLPEPVRSFVTMSAKAIGCDPSYVALPLLAALASAIGNTRRIQLKRGWSEPAIVWVAIVGESGTLKTPAFRLVLRALRKLQERALKDHAAAQKEYETELLRFEKELTAWKRRKDSPDPPAKPDPPQAERLIVSDTTMEALAPILLANPRGVLLGRDELAGWIGSFDRYVGGKGGADAAHWLSTHGGEAILVDRKTGIPRTIYVKSASVSVAGGIQPSILNRVLGSEHRESGLLARLLLAMPPRRPKHWTDTDIAPEAEAGLLVIFERLRELSFTSDLDGNPRPVLIPLTPSAKTAWIQFYNTHAVEQADLTGDLSAAWSKLEGYAARLALVVHFVRWAAEDPTLQNPDEVDEASIAAGVELSRWFGHEAQRVYGVLSESDDDRERRRLVEWIDRHGGSVTIRDLTHGLRQFRGNEDEAREALEAMIKAGWGRWYYPTPDRKGGRPAPRFELGPNVTVTETLADDIENAGFGSGDTGDVLSSEDSTAAAEWGNL